MLFTETPRDVVEELLDRLDCPEAEREAWLLRFGTALLGFGVEIAADLEEEGEEGVAA